MSEPVVVEPDEPQAKTQPNGQETKNKPHHSFPPNMVIQFTEQRKKKEVISIEDSEDSDEPQPKPVKSKERKQIGESKKSKKLSHRCMLCKQPGKKSSMKVCLDCRVFFHQACLEQQGENVLRYRCRKCRHKREQGGVVVKKGEKGEKANQQKLAGKRLQKEKKREQQQKKMGQFQQRYPYYFQEDKIRFPIEDKLLFIYRQLFEFGEAPKPAPAPHKVVPTPLLADFLQIENFFSTFQEELVAYAKLPPQINKIVLYLSLDSYGLDTYFCTLMECLIKIYLSDIFDKNKTDNVRILNENSFFTLLTHLNDNGQLTQQVLIKTVQEIIRYLATIPSMKRAFLDVAYPEHLSLKGKLQIILALIQGMSEVDEFHQLVSIKSERMQILTKQKTSLINQLKSDEAQNLSNSQKLKDMALMGPEIEQTQEGATRQVIKQLDKHRKKVQKLTTQNIKKQQKIRQIRNKIVGIQKIMPFLTTEIQFLGVDRNKSQYFFYIREPNKIYVKFHSYLLDDSQQFYVYQGKQAINQVLKSLNTKGIHQKHLFDNITSLIKDQIMNFNFEPQPLDNFMLDQKRIAPVVFQDILTMIKETEATFSVYLSLKQYQWASPTMRELFMAQFMEIDDLHILKEQIRSLQESFLFAQYCSDGNSFKRDQESQEEIKEAKQGRKKIPIRIWGINSEKTKKYWIEYLQDCIDVVGVWLCAFIFKNNVDKYVKKKMDAYYQQQQKEVKPKPKGLRQRGRPPLNRNVQKEKVQKVEKKSQSIHEPSYEHSEEPQQEVGEEARRPNLRKRNGKKMNIDSDISAEVEEIEDQDSENQDCCEICGDYGQMICCDTCPKVYHKDCLKMKDVPQGEWSCVKCLQKLSNQRQTRSRMKKMDKYL